MLIGGYIERGQKMSKVAKKMFSGGVVLLSLINCSLAGLAGVEVLSQEFCVSGLTSGSVVINPDDPQEEWIWQHTENLYGCTDCSCILDSGSSPYNYYDEGQLQSGVLTSQSNADNFGVSAMCQGGWGEDPFPFAHALAMSTIVFEPDSNSLHLQLNATGQTCTAAWMEEGFGFQLTDLTEVSEIDNGYWHSATAMCRFGDDSRIYDNLNPEHQYELTLWARTLISGEDDGAYSVELSALLAPEPATIFLLGLGIPLLFSFHRKR
jgi:hypothetical protein